MIIIYHVINCVTFYEFICSLISLENKWNSDHGTSKFQKVALLKLAGISLCMYILWFMVRGEP